MVTDTDDANLKLALHRTLGLDAATQSVTAVRPVAYVVEVTTHITARGNTTTEYRRIEIT